MTSSCGGVVKPSIRDPVLNASAAPVMEIHPALGVIWDDYDPFYYRKVLIKITWDDQDTPSVLAPLGDFFCCGYGQECIVNSAIITVVPSRGLNSYFAMPFHKHARITIENQHKNPLPAFFYQIDYCLYDSLPEDTLTSEAGLLLRCTFMCINKHVERYSFSLLHSSVMIAA